MFSYGAVNKSRNTDMEGGEGGFGWSKHYHRALRPCGEFGKGGGSENLQNCVYESLCTML